MKKPVSIRRSLLINVIVVVFLLYLTVLAFALLGSKIGAKRMAEAFMEQTLERTEFQLRDFFQPVSDYLEVLHAWGEAGYLDDSDPQQLNRFLAPMLAHNDWIVSILIADTEGREHMLLHVDDDWANRQTSGDNADQQVSWLRWTDSDPNPVATREASTYDPRSRPWFEGALAAASQPPPLAPGPGIPIHWTEPYPFYTTREPGVTAATTFQSPQGTTHVVAVDLLLTTLSRFTAQMDSKAQHKTFVLTPNGRFVGLPRSPLLNTEADYAAALLKGPEALATDPAADAVRLLLSRGQALGVAQRFHSNGEAWWGMGRTFLLGDSREFLIGVALPERDVLGNIWQRTLLLIVVTLGLLAAAVIVTIRIAARYSHPIERLMHECIRISDGDLERGPPIDTNVTEVRHLVHAHDAMRTSLKTLVKLERDLQLANDIQQSTYPEVLPNLDRYQLCGWCEPAEQTGGDSYDVIGLRAPVAGAPLEFSDGEAQGAALMLADATGHGVGSALSVLQVRAMLRMALRITTDLSEIHAHMNEQLCADLPDGRFVTAWLGLLDARKNRLTTLSAGQAPLLHYRAASDDFAHLDADGMPLGLFNTGRLEAPPARELAAGDIYAVISDGIFEAMPASGEQFGIARVEQVIRANRDADARTLLCSIRDAATRFCAGHPAEDDRTILLIKRQS